MFLSLFVLRVICICISAFTNNYFIFICISVKLITGTALQRLAERARSPGTILIPVVSQHVDARNGTWV